MSAGPPKSVLHAIVTRAPDLAETSRASYLRDLDQWIAFAGADPSGWTRKRAAEFYAELLARMKPQSANRLMSSVSYAARWWAHYENNPALHFAQIQTAKPRDRREQAVLDEATARALLETCDTSFAGIRDFALIVTGLETGMRRISLLSMTIEHTICGADPRRPYPATFVELKGRERNWIPLSDVSVLALSPWLAVLAERRLAGAVFRPLVRRAPARDPAPLSRSGVADIFETRARAAGMRHINPHLLRHTFVTWRAQAGLEPHQIAAITYHDMKLGALGGYMDRVAIGGQVRNTTPTWLAALVRERCAQHNPSSGG